MFSMKILLVMYILNISISSLSCLPVTSKPIENTPEHLAWEAWIMVPPTHDKIRKITPKSIFILPNKTNGGGNSGSNTHQLQCPPGHQAHDSRCIPLVTIDRNQILIAQLTNLLQSTDKYGTDGNNNESLNYDYDYDDYADGYNPEGSEPLVQSHLLPDYNGEPLKINLSLDKFPITKDDNKNVGNFGDLEDVDDPEDDLKVQPFRGKETSTTSTNGPIFTKPTKSGHFSHTIPVGTKQTEHQNPTVDSSLHLSDSSQSLKSPSETITPRNPTSSVLILSQSETEMSSVKPTATNETDTDYDYNLNDPTTFRTTPENDDDAFDIVTEVDGSKTSLKDDLIKEFLVFNKFAANNTEITKAPEESTEVTDLLTTTLIDSDDEDSLAQTEKFDKGYSTTSKKLEDHILNQNEAADKIKSKTSSKMESETQGLKSDSSHKRHESIQLQEDSEPLLENIESNNRFVYHHLDPNVRHRPDKPESSVPEIQEQLRIINRIVEENKRRAQQQTRVKFPTGSLEQHQQQRINYRDHIRFTDSTNPYPPQPTLYGYGSDQYAMNKHFSEQMHLSATPHTGDNQKNSKPIWWLPNGWEVDKNGDRPLLLRFWSRAPNEQHPGQINQHRSPSSSPTTSGYRENSRSPTENLYKEISAQEVYKVLGAKQWKHNR